MKHFTILELSADSESPMISTIKDVTEKDRDGFCARLEISLREHFDAEVSPLHNTFEFQKVFEQLFGGSPYQDLKVTLGNEGFFPEDLPYITTIRILETWMY